MAFATACILSYERADFLRDSIATLLETADYPLEIIVHDDGSKDPHVRHLLGTLLVEGKISTLIASPPGHNEGQGIALNRMFHAAQGDPIIKLDQDLMYHPGWLKKGITILDRNRKRREAGTEDEPEIGALGLFRYYADPVNYPEMRKRSFGQVEVDAWEEQEDFVGSAMLIPRSVWEKFGPFEEHSDAFAEDREFKMAVKEAGLALALPFEEDLVTNVGFGVGPSTLVLDHEGTVRSIHHGPHIIGGGEE